MAHYIHLLLESPEEKMKRPYETAMCLLAISQVYLHPQTRMTFFWRPLLADRLHHQEMRSAPHTRKASEE